jgi:DNA-binding transcriptional regulator YhcF (GntR family)
LSEQLIIAPLTVKKAYDELEALGYIETQRGRGTFVSAQLPDVNRADQTSQLQQSARRLLAQAYLAGLTFADTVDVLKTADRELAEGPAVAPTKESQ